MRRIRILLLLSAVGVSALLMAAMAARWLIPKSTPPAWADDYDVTAQVPETITPGAVVDRNPPAGWSHLIIKSQPRVKPSEVSRLPSSVFRNELVRRVGWMFTVFTADVVEERHGSHIRYRLRAIGLGLGANTNGRDTVLTVDTAEQLGQKLDFIQKETLTTGYRIQQQAKVVVHSPSFALVDTPVTFRCGSKNRMIRFRYALIVDPPTGRLDVLAWRIGSEADQCSDLTRAVLLNPNTIDNAGLIPDPTEFDLVGLPKGDGTLTFGVDDLPPHRLEMIIPAELRELAGKTRFTPDEAHALELGLRKLLPAQ